MPFYQLINVPQLKEVSPNSEDIIGVIDTLYDYVEFVRAIALLRFLSSLPVNKPIFYENSRR
jgi:hypothetical protein